MQTVYSIGEGVLAKMDENGDEPRSDEQFIVLEPGHKISQTFGRDAVYWYYEEDNRTSRLPFLSTRATRRGLLLERQIPSGSSGLWLALLRLPSGLGPQGYVPGHGQRRRLHRPLQHGPQGW